MKGQYNGSVVIYSGRFCGFLVYTGCGDSHFEKLKYNRVLRPSVCAAPAADIVCGYSALPVGGAASDISAFCPVPKFFNLDRVATRICPRQMSPGIVYRDRPFIPSLKPAALARSVSGVTPPQLPQYPTEEYLRFRDA